MKTLQWVSKPSVVIAIFTNQAMMDKVDALQNLVAIIAVPWTPDSIKDWGTTWSPRELGRPAKATQPAAEPDL